MSGSRTGWLALPAYLFIWYWIHGTRQYSRRIALLSCTILFLGFISLIPFQPVLVEKFQNGISEVMNYNWKGMNPDLSLTMRISFYRMGFFTLQKIQSKAGVI